MSDLRLQRDKVGSIPLSSINGRSSLAPNIHSGNSKVPSINFHYGYPLLDGSKTLLYSVDEAPNFRSRAESVNIVYEKKDIECANVNL